jgi:hypothetical protein
MSEVMKAIVAHIHRRPRSTLTAKAVSHIYTLKPADSLPSEDPRLESKSRIVSQFFGVSPKAIRDIWNHRTWKSVTLKRPRKQRSPKTKKGPSTSIIQNNDPMMTEGASVQHNETHEKRHHETFVESLADDLDALTHFGNPHHGLFSDPFHDDFPYWNDREG